MQDQIEPGAAAVLIGALWLIAGYRLWIAPRRKDTNS